MEEGLIYRKHIIDCRLVEQDLGAYSGIKYNELESQGKMHEDVLPKVTVCTDRNAPDAELSSDIVWPEGYKPDILNLVSYPGSRVVKF